MFVSNIEISSHTNIDRIYAMWQTRFPNELFVANPGTTVTINTPLAPFAAKTVAQPWTSAMVQRAEGAHIPKCIFPSPFISDVSSANSNSTFLFGFDYPETLAEFSEKQRLVAVETAMVKLYAPRAAGSSRSGVGGVSPRYPPGAVPNNGRAAAPPGYPPNLPGKTSRHSRGFPVCFRDSD